MRSLALVIAVAATACGKEEAIDFAIDYERPYFESVLTPSDTYSTTGPYLVEAYVVAPRGARRLTLHLTADPSTGAFSDLAMQLVDGDVERGRWSAALPGRPAVTTGLALAALKHGVAGDHSTTTPRDLAAFVGRFEDVRR